MTQPRAGAMRDHPGDGRYEIRIRGHLETRWAEWFEGMTLRHGSDGSTILSGPVVDQAALAWPAPKGTGHGLAAGVGHRRRARPDRRSRKPALDGPNRLTRRRLT